MNIYAQRAAALRAVRVRPAHLAALQRLDTHRAEHRNGPHRFTASLRDWGVAGTPPAAWRQVDALACQSDIAVCYEGVAQKWIDTMKARAALLGAELLVTSSGYRIVCRGKTAVVQTWRHVEMIFNHLEGDAC